MATDGHEHEHRREHGHGHQSADFDWEGMADRLEMDAAMMAPIVADVVRDLTANDAWAGARHVLDVGSGPGVIACSLARSAPAATVTALDSSAPLLARTQSRATAEGLDGRVITVEADLEAGLPDLDPADVVWASMVLHHVADPATVLADLHSRLRPGGTIVLVEFAGPSAVLPLEDPLLSSGAWARLESSVAAVLREKLGLDPVTLDWPSMLSTAGFSEITDRVRVAYHDAPLDGLGRRWIAQHVNRGLRMAEDRVPAADVAPLQDFADEAARRPDLFVRLERRVVTARRG